MKRLALILMVVGATLLGVSSFGPAGVVNAYPPDESSSITTNVPTVRPGKNFTATVSNCVPGETVIFTFNGVSKVRTCNPTTFQAGATFKAPSGPGTYPVCAELQGDVASVPSGATRPNTICTNIQVASAAPGTTPGGGVPTVPPGGLPATGSSGLGTTATIAVGLLSAGAFLLIVAGVRRRRTAAPA